MGLVGLAGGGVPPMAVTAISTTQDIPVGSQAWDSSGGKYVYTRGSSASTAAAGALVHIVDNTQALLVSTNSSRSEPVGVLMSANGSTANFGWVQVYGVSSVLTTSTLAGATIAIPLFMSSGTAGRLDSTAGAASTGQPLVSGISLKSTSATTSLDVFLNYPRVGLLAR